MLIIINKSSKTKISIDNKSLINYIYALFTYLSFEFLIKILYSQKIIPHFNKFNIFLNWDIANLFTAI